MNPQLDAHFNTAGIWREEGLKLRGILNASPLSEDLKWGKPCYTHDGRNIAILQRLNKYLALMFFKGSLLTDPHGLLHAPGPNSQIARRLHFTSVGEILDRNDAITSYLAEAIEIEEAGLKVENKADMELAEELRARLDADPEFNAAFSGLTPGRQRAYNIHFSGAKQSKTRKARIEKYAPRILAGKGMTDR